MLAANEVVEAPGKISLIEQIKEQVEATSDSGIEIWQATIENKTRDAILLHPPRKVQFIVPNYRMQFSAWLGIHPEAWDKASPGGCKFSLFVDEKLCYQIEIDPISVESDRRWVEINMDLPACRKSERLITFETEALEGEDYRWALWADPCVTITDPSIFPYQLFPKTKPAEGKEEKIIKDPIFIFGISRRSGTNFLMDLLTRHPDCKAPSYIGEDFYVARSKYLRRFVREITARWQPGWWWNYPHELNPGSSEWAKWADIHIEEEGGLLLQEIGLALLRYLAPKAKKGRLVTKTPAARSLKNFPLLFPDGKALIIIRDGRSVVESTQKTFGVPFQNAINEWTFGAKSLLDFEKKYGRLAGKMYQIVRYEDLYQDTEDQLRKIFRFLKLDSDVYNFEKALKIPVRGSSQFKNDTGQVIWSPVAKSEEFNPLKRWEHWGPEKLLQFNGIAGSYMTKLGYSLS
jgi:hypothetical protein